MWLKALPKPCFYEVCTATCTVLYQSVDAYDTYLVSLQRELQGIYMYGCIWVAAGRLIIGMQVCVTSASSATVHSICRPEICTYCNRYVNVYTLQLAGLMWKWKIICKIAQQVIFYHPSRAHPSQRHIYIYKRNRSKKRGGITRKIISRK